MQYPTATPEEIEYYKKLSQLRSTPTETAPTPQPALATSPLILPPSQETAENELISFDFPTPLELFYALNPEITLYDWQIEELLRLGGRRNPRDPRSYRPYSPQEPCLYGLLAGNGAGKDSIIIATFALWFILKGVRNRVIITSASYDQLKFQTEPSIVRAVEKATKLLGMKTSLFDSVEFHHTCRATRSEIKLFATNSGRRAEGYHPEHGEQQAIIINEAKSVEPEIFSALDRCTPYTYYIHCSSAGERKGRFYQDYLTADKHGVTSVLTPGRFYFRRISIRLHCPHVPKAYIARMEEVQTRAWIASSIDSEFFDIEQDLLYPPAFIEKMPATTGGADIGIGLDTAVGGDETVLCLRKGSLLTKLAAFREQDTQKAADIIHGHLNNAGIRPESAYTFFADYGGPGQGIIDRLRKFNWKITATIAQSKAHYSKLFVNRSIEMAWHVRRLFDLGHISRSPILQNDERLYLQLTGQKYSFDGRYRRESKEDVRARGEPSPDRADAFVLCFASYKRGQVLLIPEINGASESGSDAAAENPYLTTIRDYHLRNLRAASTARSRASFYCDKRV